MGEGESYNFGYHPSMGCSHLYPCTKCWRRVQEGRSLMPSTTRLEQGDPQDPPSHFTVNKHAPTRITQMVMCLSGLAYRQHKQQGKGMAYMTANK